jgi:CubicO group peptidase (beta-lactamase class C family)
MTWTMPKDDFSHWLLPGALIMLCLCAAVAAAPPLTQRLHEVVEQAPIDGDFTGVVLVWSGETVLLRRGYGLADRDRGLPNGPGTLFEIASLSKHFVATLAYRLVTESVLSEETTVAEIFPQAPERTGRITVDQLIHHTSGLPTYTQWENWPQLSRQPIATQVFVSELLDQTLDFEPGTRFSYSNSGYYVLGALLERASGRPLGLLLQEKVFSPAGMTASYLMTASANEGGSRAIGYERLEDGREFPVQLLVPSRSFAAGAIVSTADDLHRWSRWVQSGGLAPEITTELLAPSLGNYGGGLLVARADPQQMHRFLDSPFSYEGGRENCRVSWHWGSNPGFNAMMLWLGQDHGMLLLENREDLTVERSTRLFQLAANLVRELASAQSQLCS